MTFDESVDPPLLLDVEGYDWAPTFYTDVFLEFADRHRAAGEPWMYFLSYAIPHEPEEAPQELLDLYPPEDFALSPELIGTISESDEERFRRILQFYYALTTFLDIEVGRVLDGLQAQGQADNTIVVYLGDHGQLLGSHYFDILDFGSTNAPAFAFRTKNVPYVQAFHSPLIIRWPARIPAGLEVDALISTVDVPPTLLTLAGLPIPWRMQGVSMHEWCFGRTGPDPDAVYLSNPNWEAVWTGDYLYSPDEPYRQLFDHRSDPHELNNLIDAPEFDDVRSLLQGRLAELSAAALIYDVVPDVCADARKIEAELELFLNDTRLEPLGVTVDGMPLEAYAALVNGLACQDESYGGLLETLAGSYGFNLEVFDEDDYLDTHTYREFVAALMGTGNEVQETLSTLFANAGEIVGLSSRYEVVSREGLARGASLNEAAERRGLAEPLSGGGDLDQDGTTNAVEYANVTAWGGELTDFVIAALDPTRDGTVPLGTSGSCVIATAAYGTPLAQEIDVLRAVRDRHLLTSALGAAFTDTYYRVSPSLADFIARHERVRSAVRVVLACALLVSTHWAGLRSLLMVASLVGFGLWTRSLRRVDPIKSAAAKITNC